MADNKNQVKQSGFKKSRSMKKRAQIKRQKEKTHEERKQIKFPNKDPGFVFKRVSEDEAARDKMIQDLRAIKSSKALMSDLSRFADNSPYVPCENPQERYGPIEYHPVYGPISPEAVLAERDPEKLCFSNRH